MDNRPIGVFDSGVGGLTALRELIGLLPNEDYIYFGDTARVPYGSHSKETIVRFSQQDLTFLLGKDVKAVLIACGTASSTSIDILRTMTDIPIVGVINAAAKKAAICGDNTVVLATKATINSHAFKREILRYKEKSNVYERACPLFVPLIENGYIESDNIVTQIVVDDYTKDLHEYQVDAVILGCTHYPLIRSIIQDKFPKSIIIEAGKEAAIDMANIIQKKGLQSGKKSIGKCLYYVSEKTESFKTICQLFLGAEINETIHLVEME